MSLLCREYRVILIFLRVQLHFFRSNSHFSFQKLVRISFSSFELIEHRIFEGVTLSMHPLIFSIISINHICADDELIRRHLIYLGFPCFDDIYYVGNDPRP